MADAGGKQGWLEKQKVLAAKAFRATDCISMPLELLLKLPHDAWEGLGRLEGFQWQPDQ